MLTAKEILREAHEQLSTPNPADWKTFEQIMEDGTGPAMIEAMKRYATAACEEQRKECSRCLECDIPKGPTHNLVLYAPLPTLK